MDEYLKLGIAKVITRIIPARLRLRVARLLYNYNSPKTNGIDIVINYYNKKLKFYLNTKEFIGWNIFFFDYYEKETNKILNDHIDKDDIVIEAGANNGSESLIIGRILKNGEGRLYAFEPEPSIYKKLKINITLNEFENIIKPINLALGEQNNEVNFFLMSEDVSNQGMASKYVFEEAERTIKVKQVTLDHWAETNNIPRINFIKMDIQGGEIDLLLGAKNLIGLTKPIIFTEASNAELRRKGANIEDLYNLLKDFGYNINLITKLDLKMIENSENISEGNWLALPK